MESTGEYWKPLYNILEGDFTVFLVNAAHSIVVSAFHMLSRNESSRELGANYFDDHRRAHLVDQFTRRIERLGYHVTLEPVVAA